MVASVEGWEALREQLGDLVADAFMPTPGQKRGMTPEGEGYVLVKHEETARVDEALARIRNEVIVRMRRS